VGRILLMGFPSGLRLEIEPSSVFTSAIRRNGSKTRVCFVAQGTARGVLGHLES
jgi:hypothetical protein